MFQMFQYKELFMDKLARIKSIMAAQGPLKPGVIAHVLIGSRATVHRWLRKQVEAGELVQTGYGKYGLPSQASSVVDFAGWLRRLFADHPTHAYTVRQIGRAFRQHNGGATPSSWRLSKLKNCPGLVGW